MGDRGDIKAGGAFLSFGIRDDDTTKTWFRRKEKEFQALARKVNAIGRKLAIGALIAATPFIAAIRIYANYSKQLAFVATMLDNVHENIGKFSAGIRDLSVRFGESTETLSRGLFDILSAGFDASQAMRMLAITTTAAKAGMTDAKAATQAIIAVLNSYSLEASHAQEVSDTLFTTMKKGVLTFGELAGHIGLVAATAASAGVSMDELGATLATITRGGIETSAAVVALNNVLKAFLAPTGAAAEFAKKLAAAGLGPISVAGIKQKGFLNIMKEIAALPPDVITKLFPTLRSLRGVFALKANLSKIDEIYAAFIDKAGSTQEAMDKVAQSFGHLLDQVKQAGILILSHIGEALAGSLTNAGERVIEMAKSFGAWAKQNKAVIVGIAKTILVVGELGVTLMLVGTAMGIIASAMAAIAATAGIATLFGGLAAFASLIPSLLVIAAGIATFIALHSSISGLLEGGVSRRSQPSTGGGGGGGKKKKGRTLGDDRIPTFLEQTQINLDAASKNVSKFEKIIRFNENAEKKFAANAKKARDRLAAFKSIVKLKGGKDFETSGDRGLSGDVTRALTTAFGKEFTGLQSERTLAKGSPFVKDLRLIAALEAKLVEEADRLSAREKGRVSTARNVAESYSRTLIHAQAQFKISKNILDAEEARLFALKQSSRISKTGFFSGFFRNPVALFSSDRVINPELDVLRQIKQNTDSLNPDTAAGGKLTEDIADAVAKRKTK